MTEPTEVYVAPVGTPPPVDGKLDGWRPAGLILDEAAAWRDITPPSMSLDPAPIVPFATRVPPVTITVTPDVARFVQSMNDAARAVRKVYRTLADRVTRFAQAFDGLFVAFPELVSDPRLRRKYARRHRLEQRRRNAVPPLCIDGEAYRRRQRARRRHR